VDRWQLKLGCCFNQAGSKRHSGQYIMAHFIWTQKQDIGPPPRRWPAMAFDGARKQVVLFGGEPPPSGIAADTWAWDGHFWTQVSDTGPQSRLGHVMSFDAKRQRLVLFGGVHRPLTFLNDTWEWDGSFWSQVSNSGPPARLNAAMVFHPTIERSVLFGGLVGGVPAADTWTWDGTDWVQVADTGPSPRNHHAMGFDRNLQKLVLVGGQTGDGVVLADTWAFDGATWTQIDDIGPGPVMGAALAGTPAGLMLFGGAVGESATGGFGPIGRETWRFTKSRWTQVQDIGPSARWGHSCALDEDRDVLVVFGGFPLLSKADDPPLGLSAALGDTWELPVAADAPGPLPAPGSVAISSIVLSSSTLPGIPDATIVATVTLNSAVLVPVAVIAQIIRVSDQSPVDGLRISVSPLMIPAAIGTGSLIIRRGPNVVVGPVGYLLRARVEGSPAVDVPFTG
jgi:hypothetical protein